MSDNKNLLGATWTDDADSLVEFAWGVIANAGGGDWTIESQDWQEAASRWRALFHSWLNKRRGVAPRLSDREKLRREAAALVRAVFAATGGGGGLATEMSVSAADALTAALDASMEGGK